MAPITKADYLSYINGWYEILRPGRNAVAGSPQDPHQDVYARGEAFQYWLTGDESHVSQAVAFLRGAYAYYSTGAGASEHIGHDIAVIPSEAYLWIQSSSTLTQDDRDTIRDFFLLLEQRGSPFFEYGAHNRAAGFATSRRALAEFFPNAPGDFERRAYADRVWNDWHKSATFCDTEENSSHYNPQWLGYIELWSRATNDESFYQDPCMRNIAERLLDQITPLGVIPGYGDTLGFNSWPGSWIHAFEKFASVYHDGRFKWAAHRMYEWTVNWFGTRRAEMAEWGNILFEIMDELMAAYAVADDSVPEVAPVVPSTVTSRKAMYWDGILRDFLLVDQDVPDKLVLRKGYGTNDLYALVELCSTTGHGHLDAGAINSLVSHGTVLLGAAAYEVKGPEFHNCFEVFRPDDPTGYSSAWYACMQETISVPTLIDGISASYGQVHVENYQGKGVNLDRKLAFVTEHGAISEFIWVNDSIEARDDTLSATVGPAWLTQVIYGQTGPNWVNTTMLTLPVAQIWIYDYLMEWKNPDWDLLVLFLGAEFQQAQIQAANIDDSRSVLDQPFQNVANYRITCYESNAQLEPGAPHRFHSILMPHAPTSDASSLAASFRLLLNSSESAVLQYQNPSGGGVALFGMNEGGAALNVTAASHITVETDAKQFQADFDNGELNHLLLVEGSYFKLNGRTIKATLNRQTSESNF